MSTNQNLMQHMRELIDRIKAADVAYYRDDNPTMTDREYDLLVDELKELETTTGLILSGSPTQTVPGEILKELTPVRHTKPMLSADKTKSVDEMLRFANGRPVVLSWKLDGLTMDFHGSVDITDPCYNRDVWCRMTDVKIRNGVYTCIAWHHKDKGTFDNGEPYCYDVIGSIGIYLDGVIPCQKEMKKIGDIGVDAGLTGFFHNKPDYTDGEWAAFCDRVRHGDVWLTKEGFYSSSGYGDGCYGVYAYEQGGEITAIEIRFL